MEKDLKYVTSKDGTLILAESRTLDHPLVEKISKQDTDKQIKNLLREFNIMAAKDGEERIQFTRVLNNACISMEALQAEINSLTAAIGNFLNCLAKEESEEEKEVAIATLIGTFGKNGTLINVCLEINEKFRPQSE